MLIDGERVSYWINKTVTVRFHEKAQAWDCPELFGKDLPMSWEYLMKRIVRTLDAAAREEAKKRPKPKMVPVETLVQ